MGRPSTVRARAESRDARNQRDEKQSAAVSSNRYENTGAHLPTMTHERGPTRTLHPHERGPIPLGPTRARFTRRRGQRTYIPERGPTTAHVTASKYGCMAVISLSMVSALSSHLPSLLPTLSADLRRKVHAPSPPSTPGIRRTMLRKPLGNPKASCIRALCRRNPMCVVAQPVHASATPGETAEG